MILFILSLSIFHHVPLRISHQRDTSQHPHDIGSNLRAIDHLFTVDSTVVNYVFIFFDPLSFHPRVNRPLASASLLRYDTIQTKVEEIEIERLKGRKRQRGIASYQNQTNESFRFKLASVLRMLYRKKYKIKRKISPTRIEIKVPYLTFPEQPRPTALVTHRVQSGPASE